MIFYQYNADLSDIIEMPHYFISQKKGGMFFEHIKDLGADGIVVRPDCAPWFLFWWKRRRNHRPDGRDWN